MQFGRYLFGLSLGLALIPIYWYASANVHSQTTDLKLEHAKRLPSQYPTSRLVSSSSEHETTDLKVEHDERLPSFPTSQPVSSSSKHETTDLKKRLASQFPTLKPISSSSEHGYVVGMYYWEQLTMASNSLLELQCWAATHKLVVVQPSLEVIASYLKFTFDESLQKGMLQLSDIYNMTEWNTFSKHHNLAPLVSRDEFLREIPHLEKQAILVEIHYDEPGSGHECTFNWKMESEALKKLKVSRKVCLKNNIADVKKFDHLIFGDLLPENVVLFIREWRGISRVHINQQCKPGIQTFLLSKPLSERIMTDADAYVKKYLGSFGEYNAVLGRFEKAMDHYWTLSVATKKARIKALAQEAVERLRKLNKKTNVTTTFLAYDYGKYGSRTFLPVLPIRGCFEAVSTGCLQW